MASMTPSGAVAVVDQPFAERLDRLMMPAVDVAGVARLAGVAGEPREQRVLLDPDFVRQVDGGVRRNRELVLERSGQLAGDVLHQRAAAGDVEHLDAAADREQRQVALESRSRINSIS